MWIGNLLKVKWKFEMGFYCFSVICVINVKCVCTFCSLILICGTEMSIIVHFLVYKHVLVGWPIEFGIVCASFAVR